VNVRVVVYVLAWLLAVLGGFQLPVVPVALFYGESALPYVLGGTSAVLLGVGLGRTLGRREADWKVHPREGFLIVAAGWLVASIFGALPYVLTGVVGPVDAFFESVSGFTTTGSTVLSGLETLPRSLLLWRSFTQWIGGMGIILFTIALLPLLGIGGMQLFKAEVPGPVKDKIRPRLVETARQLWVIYVGVTVVEIVALLLAGLGPFEAVCHAFTTLATGGFSTRDLSVGGFASPAVEWIVTVFMLIAGMNFVLHYRLLQGRVREVAGDAELRYFLAVVVCATVVLAVALVPGADGIGDAIRAGVFQVVSIVTTTGFVTADFEVWPSLAQLVLLVLMILGGMSGSTAGGIKSLRVLLSVRTLRVWSERLLHPSVVRSVKYAGRPVELDVLAGVWAFLTAYGLIAAVAAALLAAAGYDLVTAFSASLTALGNVGPGLGAVGAYDNFAHMPAFAKLVLTFCMLAGRLEVFALLLLVQPSFWRR
jgi:trk system potassium uptake protein TrkH